MKTYFCNINKINENVEDFVIAKNKIEIPLIENETIEKKMTIQEFLSYVDLSQNIFMINNGLNISIPFYINQPTKDEMVIIYAYDGDNESDIQIFKENLNKINYNINSLSELSELEMLQGLSNDKPYFIINNKFYIDKTAAK